MRTRMQQDTAENLTASSSGGNFDMILADPVIITNILSRLPVKSMAQCRCVSKLLSSIIRRQNYKLLFPIKSLDPEPPRSLFTFVDPCPPRFLFAFLVPEKLVFFSSPQPQNLDENLSLVATHHHDMNSSIKDLYKLCRPVHGLVCRQLKGHACMISNPITGESVTTPKRLEEDKESKAEYYFGYDPIEKQFKVLCVTWVFPELYLQHYVLTLGTGNLIWRKIQCCKPYHNVQSRDDGICINGVVYYYTDAFNIVCFDVKSGRFDFIPGKPSTLVNYKGKLAAIDVSEDHDLVLWVLEDAKEHKWSKHVCKNIHHPWNSIAGMTDSGDIVMCPNYAPDNHFYIFYYNLKSKVTVRVRVDVPGFDFRKCIRIFAFPNYVL